MGTTFFTATVQVKKFNILPVKISIFIIFENAPILQQKSPFFWMNNNEKYHFKEQQFKAKYLKKKRTRSIEKPSILHFLIINLNYIEVYWTEEFINEILLSFPFCKVQTIRKYLLRQILQVGEQTVFFAFFVHNLFTDVIKYIRV